MFGATSANQIVGQRFLERIHPDHRATVLDRAHQVVNEREAVPFLEEQFLRLDGTLIDTEVSAIPINFEGRDGLSCLSVTSLNATGPTRRFERVKHVSASWLTAVRR